MLQILADKEAELKKLKKKVKTADENTKIVSKEVVIEDSVTVQIEKQATQPNKSTLRDYLKNNSNFSYNLTPD